MTPCPDGQATCAPQCDPPCPPGKTCYTITPGFQDGYCAWNPPSGGVTDISCESSSTNCCCKCAEIPNQPDCEFFTIANQDPAVEGCDGAIYNCSGYNTPETANASVCCNMYKPPSGSVITKECELAGAICVPCNRVPKLRTEPPPTCAGAPLLPPYDQYFAPCYGSKNPDGSLNPCSAIDSANWSEVRFGVGENPCPEQNKCTGTCFVYSQCNDDPETQVDLCMLRMSGIYCYPLLVPGSPCATPDPENQTCSVSGACPPCEFGEPIMVYNEAVCAGVQPVPYCTYTCPPSPCYGVVCPEGFICDPDTGLCVPL
jgi:hypothetical protein